MALKRYNFVHAMSRRELMKLMLAVFVLFGTHGPAFLLANSVLEPGSWVLLCVRTFLTGSFSACIILAIRKPWLGVPIAVIGLIAMVSAERISTVITGRNENVVESISQTIQITPEEFSAIREKRLAYYGVTALLVGCSWALMAIVLNSEGKKRGRLETEITIARDIQRSLLPSSAYNCSWCTISGLAIPTTEVGGDYYDVIELSNQLLAVIIADVSGHGVGAGIISAMTKSALHAQLHQDPMPAMALGNLNRTLVSLTNDKTFITCAYILLDHRTNTAHIATAGHPPILFKNKRKIVELRTPNLPLGVRDGIVFKEQRVHFQEGDLFCLYTDGIIESSHKQGEQFGIQRLHKILAGETDPSALCTNIIDAVKKHSGANEFQDDVTLVSISINKNQG